MRLKSKAIKISLVLFSLLGIIVTVLLWQGKSLEGGKLSDLGTILTKPAFAQEAETSFLEEEAGISAWISAGKSIDLTKVKKVFKTIEKDTSDYVIGSVALLGYSERLDVHVFVHKNGWIVAYYMKNDPAAKIFDANSYKSQEKIIGSNLENAMNTVCNEVSVTLKDVKYYDFRFPNANRMMIITKKSDTSQTKSFQIKLPTNFVFYERSICTLSHGNAYVTLNGKEIIKASGHYITSIAASDFPAGTVNKIDIDSYHGCYCGIFLIYKEG